MQDPGIIPQNLKILLRLAVLDLAYLGLRKPKPAPQKLLVEPFSEKLEVSGMVSVSLKHLTYVLTFKRCPEFISLKKIVPELSRGRAELVTLLAVAPPAQARSVVSGQRPAAALAMAVASSPPTGTGRNHFTTRARWNQSRL